MKAITGSLNAAHAHMLGYRTDETNSEAGGGIHGVSDVFGSALWAMHYALATVSRGAGIDFHGFLGVCGHPTVNGKNDFYTPICAATMADQQAKIMTAGPEFYGIWMAGRLGPGQFLPATVTGATNLIAYAVKGSDGATRVALIEKSATGNKVPVTIAIGGEGTAEVLRLTAPSLNATTGIQVQGASLDRQGRLTPGAPDQVTISNGNLTLDLATGSAALITVGGTAPPADAGTPDAIGAADSELPGAGDASPPDARARPDVAVTIPPGDDAAAESVPDASPSAKTAGGCQVAGPCSKSGLALLGLLILARRRARRS
jgi:hypothetical protein